MLEGKFGGVGLKNMMIISIFTILFIVMLKGVLNKHQVDGVTDIINAV